MDSLLIELCSARKLVQVRTYLASDATLAEKKAALMNKDTSGYTCLHHVCYPRVPVDVIKSMVAIGGEELIKQITRDGRTALHLCAYGASLQVIGLLITGGGKDLVIMRNDDGNTALHLLCQNTRRHNTASVDGIRLMLNVSGNDFLSARNNKGETALDIATNNGASQEMTLTLTSSEEVIRRLLLATPAQTTPTTAATVPTPPAADTVSSFAGIRLRRDFAATASHSCADICLSYNDLSAYRLDRTYPRILDAIFSQSQWTHFCDQVDKSYIGLADRNSGKNCFRIVVTLVIIAIGIWACIRPDMVLTIFREAIGTIIIAVLFMLALSCVCLSALGNCGSPSFKDSGTTATTPTLKERTTRKVMNACEEASMVTNCRVKFSLIQEGFDFKKGKTYIRIVIADVENQGVINTSWNSERIQMAVPIN